LEEKIEKASDIAFEVMQKVERIRRIFYHRVASALNRKRFGPGNELIQD